MPLAQRVHYPDAMMQWVDDLTHMAGDAVLEIHGSLEQLEPQIRKTLSDVDPNITLLSVQPLADQVDARFDQQRVVAQMAGLFGVVALILAAVGLYGVTAYGVERRTSEIGVRMALGANRSSITRLVLRGAFLQIVIGLLIGIPASIGCAHLIAAQLYQVKGWDPARSWWIDRHARSVRVCGKHCSRTARGFGESSAGAADRVTHFTASAGPFRGRTEFSRRSGRAHVR